MACNIDTALAFGAANHPLCLAGENAQVDRLLCILYQEVDMLE